MAHMDIRTNGQSAMRYIWLCRCHGPLCDIVDNRETTNARLNAARRWPITLRVSPSIKWYSRTLLKHPVQLHTSPETDLRQIQRWFATRSIRYFTTNVVEVEPTLPALSATRTASVWAPRGSPGGSSIRRSSVRSSNTPSADAPCCQGPSSTENAISPIVLSASVARAWALG